MYNKLLHYVSVTIYECYFDTRFRISFWNKQNYCEIIKTYNPMKHYLTLRFSSVESNFVLQLYKLTKLTIG